MTTSAGTRLALGRALAAAGLIALTASAGACHAAAGPGTAKSPAPPAGFRAARPAGELLTGTRLAALLLPANAMPRGFRLDRQGVRNTGGSETPDTPSPVWPARQCEMLAGTSWIAAAGIGSAAFAQNDYGNAGHTDQFAQEIDTFHGADAQQVMSRLWKAFGHCATFTDRANGVTAHTTLVRSRLRGIGASAIEAVETADVYAGGVTLVAVRVGNAVVTCLYSSSHGDKGAAAVPMAEKIADAVRAAS